MPQCVCPVMEGKYSIPKHCQWMVALSACLACKTARHMLTTQYNTCCLGFSAALTPFVWVRYGHRRFSDAFLPAPL
jgi:hypothetical protein